MVEHHGTIAVSSPYPPTGPMFGHQSSGWNRRERRPARIINGYKRNRMRRGMCLLGWKKLGLEQSLGTRLVTYADDLVILCRRCSAFSALPLRHRITRSSA